MLEKQYTAQEVAGMARVHVVTFQRWCKEGLGPVATNINGRPLYGESDVQRWLESKKVRVACTGS